MNLESSPKFIDIHAHVNFAAFDPVVDFGIVRLGADSAKRNAKIHYGVDAGRDAVVKRALEAGVWFCNVGTQADTSRKAIEIAEKYNEGVYAIVGLHPIHTGKSFHDSKELGEGGKEFTSRGEVFDGAIYRTMAKHPKVVAIGECGLDYYRITNYELGITNEDRINKKQEETFRKHVELAIEVGKPLMFHVRNGGGRSAYRDVLSILTTYNSQLTTKLRGVFHCFVGNWQEAKEILDAGFNLSFTGIITFARDYDEAVKNAPLDRIMSDTDCPYLAPTPYRGKRNEPLYVGEIVKKMAEIRGEDFEAVRAQIVKNARNFFKI